jgi:hypothetical protein
MGQVIGPMNSAPNFSPCFDIQFSVAPFWFTYDSYQALYVKNTTYIGQFNYQLYAALAQANPQQEDSNGYRELGFGICSNMVDMDKRALQPPQIYDAWDAVHSKGVPFAPFGVWKIRLWIDMLSKMKSNEGVEMSVSEVGDDFPS